LGRLLHHGDTALACSSSEGRHGHSTLPLLTRQLHNSKICWIEFHSNTNQQQKNQKNLQGQQHKQVAQVLGLCTNNNHNNLCRTLCNKKRPQQTTTNTQADGNLSVEINPATKIQISDCCKRTTTTLRTILQKSLQSASEILIH
jgi:hypothetical protein